MQHLINSSSASSSSPPFKMVQLNYPLPRLDVNMGPFHARENQQTVEDIRLPDFQSFLTEIKVQSQNDPLKADKMSEPSVGNSFVQRHSPFPMKVDSPNYSLPLPPPRSPLSPFSDYQKDIEESMIIFSQNTVMIPAKKRGRPPLSKPECCAKCSVTSTPEWRKAPNGEYVCNACGLQIWKKNKQERAQSLSSQSPPMEPIKPSINSSIQCLY
ncbi:putative GATA-binding transcription factor [Cavenderia fasciculata]|uniref:GATA-binding transcription factor n=1 Tax=Cavenderia fasciculata TaxID=261658 RepID=F4PW11_CACFS|nr:putative GATA-binding transcription factor [Cavenderia fasciculata]EGG20175.1 putative GATA-binding transcription factor [Cavenderia fasciculata]|eukprot:XP_004367158.1 putative GATA-binding transcription factor [Cavenderia fasciculata]